MIYYKYLNADGSCCNGGKGTWHLDGTPMPPVRGDLVPCKNGYHLCREKDLLAWEGDRLYVVEAIGDEIVEVDDKVVVRSARILRDTCMDDRKWRHFACDCAGRVVKLANDVSADNAINVSRKYADGIASNEDLSAARDAAWAAARDAAWDTARAAARDAARDAAWDTAWDMARAAAWAAARDAARAAAWKEERKWQIARLMQYINGDVL